ncbi:MAG: hypothetical protein BWK73_01660 [Thiothrix lacustris]|uniref:Uncharacterized protein n=1 Tax=Thiothrix lacustris TaxID=525917 RepID=A0A1Y1R0R1_9GAMM|nr:MAG: hypothetical protein BWK73_01660 [Thiothrix lacustris]
MLTGIWTGASRDLTLQTFAMVAWHVSAGSQKLRAGITIFELLTHIGQGLRPFFMSANER